MNIEKTALFTGLFFCFIYLKKKMKLHTNNWIKARLLVLSLAFIVLLTSCEKKYTDLTIQEELISNIQKLNQKVVDFENVAPKTSFITPVPGGVGPMTIASLLLNTLKAAELRQH